jgi:pimeloyl-ACP methyl ester carboxylesterase
MKKETISLFADTLQVRVNDGGTGRPFLLLHGGAGTKSMEGLAGTLAENNRVILPTHPGFDGTLRPDWFQNVADLVTAYVAMIEKLDLRDVVVVGNSAGGWIAAELGLRSSPRISSIILLNSVGLDPTEESGPIVDPLMLESAERSIYAFHDPATFEASLLPEGGLPVMIENQKSLLVYAGEPFMHDPTLRDRLPRLACRALVLWGESDRIVTSAYGRQFAEIIPGVQFQAISGAGHFPQIEQLETVTAEILNFV